MHHRNVRKTLHPVQQFAYARYKRIKSSECRSVCMAAKSIMYPCALGVCFVAMAYQAMLTTTHVRNELSLTAIPHFCVGKTGNYKSCSSHIALEQENANLPCNIFHIPHTPQ